MARGGMRIRAMVALRHLLEQPVPLVATMTGSNHQDFGESVGPKWGPVRHPPPRARRVRPACPVLHRHEGPPPGRGSRGQRACNWASHHLQGDGLHRGPTAPGYFWAGHLARDDAGSRRHSRSDGKVLEVRPGPRSPSACRSPAMVRVMGGMLGFMGFGPPVETGPLRAGHVSTGTPGGVSREDVRGGGGRGSAPLHPYPRTHCRRHGPQGPPHEGRPSPSRRLRLLARLRSRHRGREKGAFMVEGFRGAGEFLPLRVPVEFALGISTPGRGTPRSGRARFRGAFARSRGVGDLWQVD